CERQQHLSRIANLAEQLAEAQGKVEHCGQENCMGYKLDDAANWVREERLIEALGKLDAIAALARQGQYVWVSALDRISPAQGKETADIETLREMVHAFYEGGRPITKEQLDAFCAVGGEEKE
ncbi:hypothetical protein LCGC14_1523710, partial [marine sediment metagenome]